MMIITHLSSKDQKNNSFLRLVKEQHNKSLNYKVFMHITEKDLLKSIMVVKMTMPYTDNGLSIKLV